MKYIISELKYKSNDLISMAYHKPDDINILKQKGYIIKPSFISGELCKEIRDTINDNLHRKRVWQDSVGSDHRIHGFGAIMPKATELLADYKLMEYYKSYIDRWYLNSFLLAGKLQHKEDNLGSGGGWHRDSINVRQLKFILYLSDVAEKNGPFQYLPETHTPLQKFKINKLLKKSSSEYRYTPDDIEILKEHGYKMDTLVAKAGTLLVAETSGIHRGKPIQSGVRYALTKYMYDRPIPKKFFKLMED